MQKLIPAALLVMVLIAAPVLAQETTSPDTPDSASPGESPETLPEPAPPAAQLEAPAAEPTPPAEEPAPPPAEPAPPPAEPAPPPSELGSTPDPGTAQELPPQDPPPEAVLPEVPQEVVEDKKADDGDLEQRPGNQESILGALRQAADEQKADGDEADQVEEDLDDIANLIQRLEDQKDDTSNLQQRNGDRKGNNNDDDDDDNGPGRKDKDNKKEDRDDDIKLETDQEAESGDVDQSVDISNSGDYAQQCVAVLQAANTGNAQNAPAFLQYSGDADDFEPGGIGIDISPQIVQDCRQIIRQTTVVNQLLPGRPGRSGAGRPGAGQPSAQRPGVAGAGLPPRVAGAGFSGAGSGGAFNVPTRLGQPAGGLSGIGQARIQPLNAPSVGRVLPRTGGPGTISLLTLGAGALLIAGGLLVRRISR